MSHSSSPVADSDLAWCFSTLGCPELTLGEIAALAREHSVPRVELRTVAERLDLPALFQEEFGSAKNLKRWLADEKLEVVALDSSAKLIDCPEDAREELLAFGEWANALGIPAIRVFDGGQTAPELSPENRDEATAFLRWWESECSKNNWSVELIVETHDALCTTAACLELSVAVDGDLAILWDAHHTWRKGGEDPFRTWEAIQSLVKHIHFKDSIGKPSARHPFTYTHLGQGEFPLQAFLDRLREDRFTGPVSLEWERKWHPYLDPLSDALAGLQTFRR